MICQFPGGQLTQLAVTLVHGKRLICCQSVSFFEYLYNLYKQLKQEKHVMEHNKKNSVKERNWLENSPNYIMVMSIISCKVENGLCSIFQPTNCQFCGRIWILKKLQLEDFLMQDLTKAPGNKEVTRSTWWFEPI